jgi:hypothetical protein
MPRRLPALALFTLAESLLVSLDPVVAVGPAAVAFLLGSLALTPSAANGG